MVTLIIQDVLLKQAPPKNAIVFHTTETWRSDLDKLNLRIEMPSIFHCTIEVALWLKRWRKGSALESGVILPDGLETANQMALLGDLLLNDTGLFTPFCRLESQLEFFQNTFGQELFIKPNSEFKPFSGRPLGERPDLEIAGLKQIERVNDKEMCFIGPAKEFDQPEWRFWMVDGRVAGHAPYSFDGQTTGKITAPMQEIACKAAERLVELDMMIVIDVVNTQDGPRVMEANGYSTSGFYPGVDIQKMHEFASELFT